MPTAVTISKIHAPYESVKTAFEALEGKRAGKCLKCDATIP